MGLKINYTFDTSVTDLNLQGNAVYNPTLYSEYTNAVLAAVNYFDSVITNNITVNINFGWGEAGGSPIGAGASGQSTSVQYTGYTYADVLGYLRGSDTTSDVQIAAVKSLTSSDPTGGASFSINAAELKALGGHDANDPANDGSVGLDASDKTNFTWIGQTYSAGSEDAVGTLEHEISEVLGRSATGGKGGTYTPLDLFRYTAADGKDSDPIGAAAGVRDEPFVGTYDANAPSYFSYDGSTVTLLFETPTNVGNGADVADWSPAVGQDSFADGGEGAPTPVSPTDLQVMNVLGYSENAICYLRGTNILTPTGQVRIEDLQVGDRVVSRFSGIQPIRWIGQQRYDSRFLKDNRQHIPVCIRAGALADHRPSRDLYVSPGHSMLLEGHLVLARSLVNGVTITQDSRRGEIHYFQVELEHHDCIIAEGAWSETFADGPGLRDQFHNAAAFAKMYPDCPPPSELSLCAPRPEAGSKLDAVLRPVVARAAGALNPGPLRGYIDRIEAPWTIAGWAVDTDHPELPVLLEVLLGESVISTILACDYRQDLHAAGVGQGRCAFFLTTSARLQPALATTLRVRRAADHAEIFMTPGCVERVGAAQHISASRGDRGSAARDLCIVPTIPYSTSRGVISAVA